MNIQTTNQNTFQSDDKCMSRSVDESQNNISGNFECNICLDSVQDPVVTLCGHLYCWPCIYKWIQHQKTSSETLENSNSHCPVCKTEVSEKTIVPLYGRSQIMSHGTKEKGQTLGPVIPPRPSTPRLHSQGTRDRGGYQRLAPPPLAMPGRDDMNFDSVVVHSPTIGMLGEMVSGRLLGDLDSPLFGTPNSYNRVGTSNRRERWQTTQADRSLSRICSFLFSCMIFCLLMFT
ncbi:zinc finger, RING/FYVE/PHD-type [Artemisia annua]|uniref:E3 ubiquitin-protein ligase RMA n=1 Tax=Artemisia annua TaxID=35608 RepID=A0A2U1P053_ARTAN|nr:zinc finger, RING/FYVE/PHD-type [Artemisia annua]